jgi:hypothetical protein
MEIHYRNINVDSKKYTGEHWGKLLIINIWSIILELLVHAKQSDSVDARHSVSSLIASLSVIRLSPSSGLVSRGSRFWMSSRLSW